MGIVAAVNQIEECPVNITIRPMAEQDIPSVNKIISLAFGTFIGVPEPERWSEDRDYGRVRFAIDPSAAFVAMDGDRLIGSNFGTRWGSVGFFGPVTVHPEYWDKGVGQQLLDPIMQRFDEWDLAHAGLFTFAHSPKHQVLYQKYGFWPRFLTSLMGRPAQNPQPVEYKRFSAASGPERECLEAGIKNVSDSIFPGLDLSREIETIGELDLGDTVAIQRDGEVVGFAVCHCGRGTEAGDQSCFTKFAGVRPGENAATDFEHLLDAVEHFAADTGHPMVVSGVNQARRESYQALLKRGYRVGVTGVSMHRPDEPGYSVPGRYVLDDWR